MGTPSPEPARNLGSVFETSLRLGTVTRNELIAATGLSKATVARLVDELTNLGVLVATAQATEPRGRGRIPDILSVSRDLGQVIGVSFGLRRSVVLSTDLAGRGLFHRSHETPPWSTVEHAVSWVQKITNEARKVAPHSPLRRIVVAIPARVINGAEVSHPPSPMAELEGAAFVARLSRALDAEVVLDSDANTALAAILAEEHSTGIETTVLLNMGTALTVSQSREDGSAVQGRSSAFGNLSLIPFTSARGVSTVGGMLSRHGLELWCRQQGVPLDALSGILLGSTPPSDTTYSSDIEGIAADFLEATLSAIRMIVVTIDPGRIILAGRLVPLVERILPELTYLVAEEISDPPLIQAVGLHGTTHSTAHGAAHIGVAQVQRLLRDEIAAGRWPLVPA